MKTIRKLSKNVSKGTFGFYIVQKNGRGLKILRNGFLTIEGLLKSVTMSNAFYEAYYLSRASAVCTFVPRCYGLDILKLNGKFHVAISMQNIKGDEAYEYIKKFREEAREAGDTKILSHNTLYDEYTAFAKYLNKQMRKKAGLVHQDIKLDNVFVSKDLEVYLIDFTAAYIKDADEVKYLNSRNQQKLKKKILLSFKRKIGAEHYTILLKNKHLFPM